jgi:hypothetical protein
MKGVTFFAYHTVLTDYHWDCHTFLSSYTPPLRTDYDSLLKPIMTHTSTPTNSTCGLRLGLTHY